MADIGDFKVGDDTQIEQIDIVKDEYKDKKFYGKIKINPNLLCLMGIRIIYAYLPLVILLILKKTSDLQGSFLAISYVFLSQVATTKWDKDHFNNLLFALRIALAIISLSISFLSDDDVVKNWYIFCVLCFVSLLTLYANVIKENQP